MNTKYIDKVQQDFLQEVNENIKKQSNDVEALNLATAFMCKPSLKKYSYNFSWLGRPIIQYPQDMIAMQELIFRVQPDLIIETGIAHGGSIIFYASLLELNAICGGSIDAHVIGIDVDIRPYNRIAIENHPMFKLGRISLYEGSSIDADMIAKIKTLAKNYQNIMVLLDSNHTHEHVLAELNAYANLVTTGSYCVVFDTIVERMPCDAYPDRSWTKGNSPMTAVQSFLQKDDTFEIDVEMDAKLLISVAPSGYLRKK